MTSIEIHFAIFFLFATSLEEKSLIFWLKIKPPKIPLDIFEHLGNTKFFVNTYQFSFYSPQESLFPEVISRIITYLFVSDRNNWRQVFNEAESVFTDRVRYRIAYHKFDLVITITSACPQSLIIHCFSDKFYSNFTLHLSIYSFRYHIQTWFSRGMRWYPCNYHK